MASIWQQGGGEDSEVEEEVAVIPLLEVGVGVRAEVSSVAAPEVVAGSGDVRVGVAGIGLIIGLR